MTDEEKESATDPISDHKCTLKITRYFPSKDY